MRSKPEGLATSDLVVELEGGWGIEGSSISYLAVGAGSHHWRVEDRSGRTWFVTVDELDARRVEPREARADVLDRLTAALATAHALERAGADYVVAPIAGCNGGVVRRLGDRWAVAVYPMIDGATFRGGQRLPESDRLAVVALIARLHSTPLPSPMLARSDDHRLQNRADLQAAMTDPCRYVDVGPCSGRLAALLAEHRRVIENMLAEYDDLVASVRTHPARAVFTHGEPHAGNVMRTRDGWRLVDWDTTLVAAPERDLWLLETGDGAASAAYTKATGIELRSERLALFELRWDLADLSVGIARLRAPHTNNADDAQSWDGIAGVLARRSSGAVAPPAAWR